DIPVGSTDYPLAMGVKYAVTVTAWRSFTTSDGTSGEVPGAGHTPWTNSRNLNVDTDGDGNVDLYPDSGGTGNPDIEVGTLVHVTATVTAGGNADVDPTVKVFDQTGAEIEPAKLEWVRNADKTLTLTLEYRVLTSETAENAAKYSIKITKDGCTYFELTDIPMISSVTGIDMGRAELYVGDANGDGKINNADISVINRNFGKDVSVYSGDVDGNGKINNTDVSAVSRNFGKTSTSNKYVQI
ncbi:MAG: hypothetical protein HFF09_07825, partial [Oscillospiraceae bacterium]|nr:hypothetical protein [Oscillospiraceae bacterium]